MLLAVNSACKIKVAFKYLSLKKKTKQPNNVTEAESELRRSRSEDKELIVHVPVIQREELLCPVQKSEYESPL